MTHIKICPIVEACSERDIASFFYVEKSLTPKTLWFIFDGVEEICGPYQSEKIANQELDMYIEELYFLDYYPNPYVDFILEDEYEELAYKEKFYKTKEIKNGF